MIDLEDYGWFQYYMPSDATGMPARITAVHRERYQLICQHGIVNEKLKKSIYVKGSELYPTVGDFVLIQYQASGDSLIIKTLPRKSYFSRREPVAGHGEQAIAANIDTCFVLTSLNYDFNLSRLERFISVAISSGATPVVLLTKADLIESFDKQIEQVQKIAKGVAVYAVSAVTGHGIEQAAKYLMPKTTAVFLGTSGVGKSSLVNALSEKAVMQVKGIRKGYNNRGRHTTTHRQLIMLSNGAMLIDTPGMRQLSMWDADDGVSEVFSDIDDILLRGCKFSDCKHDKEPGCAIKQAIENGELPLKRWQNFLRLKTEIRYTDDWLATQREKKHWLKEIAKYHKSKADKWDR